MNNEKEKKNEYWMGLILGDPVSASIKEIDMENKEDKELHNILKSLTEISIKVSKEYDVNKYKESE